MNSPQIISINPGRKTVGERLQEARQYEPMVQSIVTSMARKPKCTSILNALTGISSKNMAGTSRRLLLLRFVTSLILGAAAYYTWYSGTDAPIFIPLIALATSLLLGFATRIVSIGIILTCGYFAVIGLEDPFVCVVLAFAAMVFAILGPGIFSVDQCIRKAIFHMRKRNRNRDCKNPEKLRFDYKCYNRI